MGMEQMWAFPSKVISFKQKEIIKWSFHGSLTAEGKEARQLLQCGIAHGGLGEEMAAADMILELV